MRFLSNCLALAAAACVTLPVQASELSTPAPVPGATGVAGLQLQANWVDVSKRLGLRNVDCQPGAYPELEGMPELGSASVPDTECTFEFASSPVVGARTLSKNARVLLASGKILLVFLPVETRATQSDTAADDKWLAQVGVANGLSFMHANGVSFCTSLPMSSAQAKPSEDALLGSVALMLQPNANNKSSTLVWGNFGVILQLSEFAQR